MRRLLAAAFLLVAFVACDLDNPFKDDSPSEPGVIVTTLTGTCRATTAGAIVCEDRSATEPAERIRSITFNLQGAAGLLIEARTADPHAAPPRQVQFLGLNPGTYQVEHVVVSDDSRRTSLVYRGIDVF